MSDHEDNNEEVSTPRDERGRKIIKLREETVLEKQLKVKALEKQKQNITKPQIVQGKEFKGDSFACKPSEIVFQDFEVGEPYVQTVQLTNVSNTQNSFKLLLLKEKIRDYFEIMYKPPGRISAGMACPITIRFTAQINEDIEDVFPILTETGPINIPLKCYSKKAIVRCENPVVDFEQVIFGEDNVKYLVLENKGALQTEVIIKSKDGGDILTRTETTSQFGSQQQIPFSGEGSSKHSDENKRGGDDIAESLAQLKFAKQYIIKGYSSLKIPIKYVPNKIQPLFLPLVLYFENFLHSRPIDITIRGECIEVPIYVEKPLYDFEICLLNHIYREKIVFYNRSSTAMKTQIVAPKETKSFFEFNPLLGYIQGNSKFEVWVKMNADKDLLTLCSKFLDTKTGILDIPFKLIGAGQVMPVQFMIRAKMTIDTVQITPGKINFGKLYEGTAARMPLTCENLSDLPQEILFYPLPKEISVELDLIPLKLLPKEKFQTNLIYRSTNIAGIDSRKDEGYLKCKIITGNIATKDLRLPYSCDIMKCQLEFSAMKIDIPVMQVDETFNTTLMIKNTTQKTMIFEFFLPKFEIGGLKLTPMVDRIKSEESVEINIEYQSFFKKISKKYLNEMKMLKIYSSNQFVLDAFTLDELTQKYDNDPNHNFALKMKMKKDELEKERLEAEAREAEALDPKAAAAAGKDKKKGVEKKEPPPKKEAKLNKNQQQAFEEEQKRLEELAAQKEEEERQKKLEIEKNFDLEEELAKLGGKLLEFHHDDPTRYSQHYTWLIPCYFKPIEMPDTSKSLTFIEINTVTVQKSLVLDKTVIDFGEIAVGIKEIQQLIITNNSDQVVSLSMDLLPLFSGFNIINALREIEPSKSRILFVQFQPHEDKPFEETLRIKCRTTCVSAKLKGKGVRPEVKIVPENGLLNVGGVVLGEKVEKSFKVLNVSNFPIKFKVASISHGIYNKFGSKVFSFSPSEAQIEANKEMEIKVTFQPDRVSEQFFELISIFVPNQKDEKQLFVWGSCYPRQGYVTHFKPYLSLPASSELPHKIESVFDTLKIQDEELIFSPKNPRILLEFTKIKTKETLAFVPKTGNDKAQALINAVEPDQADEKQFQRKIIVGNSKIASDPKLEKPVNFEVIMPKDDKNNYFICDNLKGVVAPGTETVLSFKFKPPAVDPLIASIEALQGLGQWKDSKAELKLTGGFLNPGQQDVWIFEVNLRAYINQI